MASGWLTGTSLPANFGVTPYPFNSQVLHQRFLKIEEVVSALEFNVILRKFYGYLVHRLPRDFALGATCRTRFRSPRVSIGPHWVQCHITCGQPFHTYTAIFVSAVEGLTCHTPRARVRAGTSFCRDPGPHRRLLAVTR